MVLPALRALEARLGRPVELQLVGVVRQEKTLDELSGMRLRFLFPRPGETVYPLFLQWFTTTPRWDVAIAPLRDTAFGRCKSDVKLLDYAALGVPGVYSRVPAYAGSVRHGETGWLVENESDAWLEALATLLSDEELRRRTAAAAGRYLWRERTLARRAADWVATFRELAA
jgi:glycosyltransferase involved in cell wall biosynthesis